MQKLMQSPIFAGIVLISSIVIAFGIFMPMPWSLVVGFIWIPVGILLIVKGIQKRL